jgi:hypothetical protein
LALNDARRCAGRFVEAQWLCRMRFVELAQRLQRRAPRPRISLIASKRSMARPTDRFDGAGNSRSDGNRKRPRRRPSSNR